MTSQTLDVAAIPLCGLHLIEASAGTGKTYAITNLVLRLLLEDGLGIDQVLILTFTNAATEELRERVAKRLRQALAVLDGAPLPDDPALAAVLGPLLAGAEPGLDSNPAVALARLRLAEAISRQDEAAIDTIHGFCLRVLQDHAFESGQGFELELIQDQGQLERQAIEDLWRRTMARASRERAAWLLGTWPDGPTGLRDTLRACAGPVAPQLLPRGLDRNGDRGGEQGGEQGADGVGDQRRERGGDRDGGGPDRLAAVPADALEDWRTRLRAAWTKEGGVVLPMLRDSDALKRNIYSTRAMDQISAAVADLLGEVPPAKLPDKFLLLSRGKLAASALKGKTAPAHSLFDLCAEVDAERYQALLRERRAAFLYQARRDWLATLAQLKADRRVLYFDDLLLLTAAALDGPFGETLAARLRAAYPKALIDEFQDTDPLQYRILRRIYDGQPDRGLFLIGDPKQAIYAFRGADVFTYVTARRHAQASGKLWTLDTNWRSASALVQAVNAVFQRAHAPFIYTADIPFQPVRPGPQADATPLVIDGAGVPPLELRWLPLDPDWSTRAGDRLKADGARTLAAGDAAARIGGLIAAGNAGRARIGEAALAARDIAVLVRTHHEAGIIRGALAARGIASVSVGQASVFASDEAADLSLLLAALDDGADEGLIRAALATRLLGWDAPRIAALDTDESGWEALLARFDGYRRCWQGDGFLPACWRLLHGEEIIANLRRLADGERRLTNLLHLAELAQVAASAHPGGAGLRRWLEAQCADPPTADEGQLLRLESDADLVRIVTLHKSKGLEFPVVLLPFPWSNGRAPDQAGPVAFHDDDGAPWLDLGSAAIAESLARRAREDLAEGLRLLYVGLTRARHLCIVHWGAVNGAGNSAAAYLLHPDPNRDGPGDRTKDKDPAMLRAELATLVAQAPAAIRIVEADAAAAPGVTASGQGGVARGAAVEGGAALRAQPFSSPILSDWRLTSFSGLAGSAERDRPDYDALTDDAAVLPDPLPEDPSKGDLPPEDPLPDGVTTAAPPPVATPDTGAIDAAMQPTPPIGAGAIDPVFRFPRGIRAGHCLHGIFEGLDFPSASGATLTEAVQRGLARHGIAPGWSAAASEIVNRTLDTVLLANDGTGDQASGPTVDPPGAPLRLRDIASADRLDELEFHFALDAARPGDIDRVLAAHGYPTIGAAAGVGPIGSAAVPLAPGHAVLTASPCNPPAESPFEPPAAPQIGTVREPVQISARPRLRGLMKGYIDLVFRWQGRYYIADYKSNHLGDSLASYHPAAIAGAMRHHRYHLQYLIYSVALHRWLRQRLPDYAPERHLGGVFYLFLRGMHPAHGPRTGVFHDHPDPALIDALDRAFGGSRKTEGP